MKAYVITILDNPDSVKASEACMESFKRNNPGLEIAQWEAKTPDKDDIYEIARAQSIPVSKFEEVYSRFDRCLAAFLSHYSIWDFVANHTKENTLIFEHDAYVTNKIPRIHFNSIINLGKPSYGKFNIPSMGVGPMMSKAYLPGAHAYAISPKGAKNLVKLAKTEAGPTDIFINNIRFPSLQEYYPWPAECRDTFTTIQQEAGCLAKHNYGDDYGII